VVTVRAWTLRERTPLFAAGAVVTDWFAVLTERVNVPDTLTVTGCTRDLVSLATKGGGCTLEDSSGVRFSGVLAARSPSGDGRTVLRFDGDSTRWWERIAYPSPAAPITAQTTDFGDVRTGPAETVALGYLAANAGPAAPIARRITGLTVPPSLGRGPTVTVTARLDNLGRLVADTAEVGLLRVRAVPSGAGITAAVTVMPNMASTARFGTSRSGGPGMLADDWTDTESRPTCTAAEVAGGGQGTARTFRERLDTAASALWGCRVEVLVDQRQTTVPAELDKAGDEALADGSAPVAITATVLDSPQLRLGVDVPLGAMVTLDLDGDVVTDRLRVLTTTISGDAGRPTVQITGQVGTEQGLSRTQKEILTMRKSIRKVQAS
jgi:hypothetical protein